MSYSDTLSAGCDDSMGFEGPFDKVAKQIDRSATDVNRQIDRSADKVSTRIDVGFTAIVGTILVTSWWAKRKKGR